MCEAVGLRAYTSVLSGTSPTGNPTDYLSLFAGCAYVILHFLFVLGVSDPAGRRRPAGRRAATFRSSLMVDRQLTVVATVRFPVENTSFRGLGAPACEMRCPSACAYSYCLRC